LTSEDVESLKLHEYRSPMTPDMRSRIITATESIFADCDRAVSDTNIPVKNNRKTFFIID
jgi:hypothetical protein